MTDVTQFERLEDLGEGGLCIYQNPKLYTFTSDSVLLADFCAVRSKDECVEIGCGCGVISVLQLVFVFIAFPVALVLGMIYNIFTILFSVLAFAKHPKQ